MKSPPSLPHLGVRSIRAARLSADGKTQAQLDDEVVVEEPLEIRIDGDPFAVTMRTPGHDRELALGFLLSEGVIQSVADVFGAAHCGRPGSEGYGNTLDVKLCSDATSQLADFPKARRGTLVTSACGVCGRQSITDLLERIQPLPQSAHMKWSTVARATSRLSEHQPIFARTGGVHAACLIDAEGQTLGIYEDIGRHNAVDKLIGARALAHALPARHSALIVSGRVSFEIVQKAFTAGIPIIAAVSAPSSLAIELAERANIALAGFVRSGGMTIYSGQGRLEN